MFRFWMLPLGRLRTMATHVRLNPSRKTPLRTRTSKLMTVATPLLGRTAMTLRSCRQRGFTLVEMLLTSAIIAIVAGIGVPLFVDMTNSMRLGDAARAVERELQTARLTAVSANQPMRVRFNCPGARQFRMTELVGTPKVPAGADSATNRCNLADYPYPSDTDKNAITRPNRDGPLRELHDSVTITTATTIEFWPDGSAHVASGSTNPWPPIGSSGSTITLTRNGKTKSITVNSAGKIQLQ